MKQSTFAGLTYAAKKKQTRREKFLDEMEQVVPWAELEAVIEPHYPKASRRGGQPKPFSAMLRIYFMQQWYGLSDPGMEDRQFGYTKVRCKGPAAAQVLTLVGLTNLYLARRVWVN